MMGTLLGSPSLANLVDIWFGFPPLIPDFLEVDR